MRINEKLHRELKRGGGNGIRTLFGALVFGISSVVFRNRYFQFAVIF